MVRWFWVISVGLLSLFSGGCGDDAGNSAVGSMVAEDGGDPDGGDPDGGDTGAGVADAEVFDVPPDAPPVLPAPGAEVELPARELEREAGLLPVEVPPGFALVDLGVHPTLEGVTGEIFYEADEEVTSFTVIVLGPAAAQVVVWSAVDPSGVAVVAPEPSRPLLPYEQGYIGFFGGQWLSENRVIARQGASAGLFPNTPQVPMRAGTWTLRAGAQLSTYDESAMAYQYNPVSSALHVYVLERRAPERESGSLSLTLHFSGAGGLTAATAPEDVGLMTSLARLGTIYATVGVAVEEVRYVDLAASDLQVIPLSTPGCLFSPALGALLERPEPEAQLVGAINVFFIERFECVVDSLFGPIDAGMQLAGLSNGVPGLPLAAQDGVIMATHLREDYPQEWALVMSHELGHFLGLFHTQESGLELYDNIPDTPDEPGPDENSYDYLMYGKVEGSTLISPQQGEVMRRSAWVR